MGQKYGGGRKQRQRNRKGEQLSFGLELGTRAELGTVWTAGMDAWAGRSVPPLVTDGSSANQNQQARFHYLKMASLRLG